MLVWRYGTAVLVWRYGTAVLVWRYGTAVLVWRYGTALFERSGATAVAYGWVAGPHDRRTTPWVSFHSSRPRSWAASRNPNGSSTGPSWPAGSHPGYARGSSGDRRRNTWPGRRMTRPCWRSGSRSGPAWTSWATARSAGRATPTTSPPRCSGSTSTSRARRWTAAGTPTRSPGWLDRSAGRARCRWPTCDSCATTRTAPSRSRCPARSRCRSRLRTTTTATRRSWPRRTRTRSTRRCATSSAPVPTSSSWTSRTCRRARTRLAGTAWPP